MAKKYGMVKCYFEHGLWSPNQVKYAVTKGLIDSEEYKIITGEDFDLDYLKTKETNKKKPKSVKQYIINAFTDEAFSGRQTAVCVLNNEIPEELMQKIAVENKVETTAFILKNGKKYSLRWFGGMGEVDICGYSILSCAYVILNYYEKNKDEIEFETKLGNIGVEKNDDVFEVDFPQYHIEKIDVTKDIIEAVGAKPRQAMLGRDLVLIFDNESEVENLKPNMDKLKKIKGMEVHVTAVGERYDCLVRSFSPKTGLNEGSIYGIGHCYVAPYWMEQLDKNVIVSRMVSKRGGTVFCKTIKEGRIRLCGKAVVYSEAEIYIE